ncbi:MAG: hypothetical protein HY261_06115 [Chloroflexi bacterium]|nr:hypothetical protein [Chloroflexota bacterium]
MQQRRGRALLLASISGLAVVLAVSACSGGSSPTSAPTTSPTPDATPTQQAATPTPFPTVTPTPAVAPPATPQAQATATPGARPSATPIPTPDSPGTPDVIGPLKTYTDDKFGLAVDYPSNWQTNPGDVSQGEFLFEAEGRFGFPRLLVDLVFQDAVRTLPDTAAQVLKGIQTNVQGLQVINQSPIQLADGSQAYEYVLDIPSDTLPIRGNLVVAVKGSRVFEAFSQTVRADFDARKADLQKIARSIRLSEPKPFGATKADSAQLFAAAPTTFDPHRTGDITSFQYVAQIFNGLVTFDRNLKIVPGMAESWDVTDGGLTYTFHLRKGAKFHSGKAVTAADVKYSLERAASPTIASRITGVYLDDIAGFTERRGGLTNEVTGVTVVDDSTVRIRIKQAVPYFLSKLAHSSGFILNKDNVEKGGSTWFVQPDGTGPYKLKGIDPGVVVVLERNDDYYGPKAKTKYIVIWNVTGSPTAMYRAGDADITPVGGTEATAAQDKANVVNAELTVTPELSVTYVGFNIKLAPFNDVRARKAIALAIDRDGIIKDIVSNTVQKATGFVPLGMPGYTSNAQGYAYDPAQAKQLWDAFTKEKGAVTKLNFLVQGGAVSTFDQKIGDMLKQNLGIDVTFQATASDDRGAAVAGLASNLFEFGWIADYPDPHNFLDVLFYSQAINNTGRYSSPDYDKLVEAARTEADPAKRVNLYRQADAMLLQDVVGVPIWYGRSYTLTKPYVKGYFQNAQGIPDYATIEVNRPPEAKSA